MVILASVLMFSCDKKDDSTTTNDNGGEKEQQELVNQLPTTIWTAEWSSSTQDIPIPYKATLVFEDELVRMEISTLELRVDGLPPIFHGSNKYKLEGTSDGKGQVSFNLSFLSNAVIYSIPETSFSGVYDPSSEVLTLKTSSKNGNSLLGAETLVFKKDLKQTTLTNPLPATTWNATWSRIIMEEVSLTYKAILDFEGTSVNMVITPDMKVDGASLVLYGSAPYQFQLKGESDLSGIVSFKIATSSTHGVYNIPETTFSGEYNPNSNVMTLNLSSTDNSFMGKDAIDFVKD